LVEVTARILEDLLKVEGVSAVLLVGRDGFVIEKAGDINDVDALGALSISLLGAAETI
jgi:predicted regulator of Ras-like GTPase activity (Roadblock/LC7/MglB family)